MYEILTEVMSYKYSLYTCQIYANHICDLLMRRIFFFQEQF